MHHQHHQPYPNASYVCVCWVLSRLEFCCAVGVTWQCLLQLDRQAHRMINLLIPCFLRLSLLFFQDAVPAGVELCGGGEMALSIANSIDRLIDGDEKAAVFKSDLGELMVRPL